MAEGQALILTINLQHETHTSRQIRQMNMLYWKGENVFNASVVYSIGFQKCVGPPQKNHVKSAIRISLLNKFSLSAVISDTKLKRNCF